MKKIGIKTIKVKILSALYHLHTDKISSSIDSRFLSRFHASLKPINYAVCEKDYRIDCIHIHKSVIPLDTCYINKFV